MWQRFKLEVDLILELRVGYDAVTETELLDALEDEFPGEILESKVLVNMTVREISSE